MPEERLQKILSRFGAASRRRAEDLILTGQVTVSGKTVLELGTKADADRDDIRVAGKRLRAPKRLLHILLHKPKNCMTTTSDPQGRQTVMEFVKGYRERLYPVGRLDYHSEGALLLTNDGEFANGILASQSQIRKVYEVKVNGRLTPEQEEGFRRGVPLHGRRSAPARLRRIREGENPWYEVEVAEGRHHQVRLMFQHFGLMVEKLKRTRIGFLELGALKPCAHRLLTPAEVARFRALFEKEKRERN